MCCSDVTPTPDPPGDQRIDATNRAQAAQLNEKREQHFAGLIEGLADTNTPLLELPNLYSLEPDPAPANEVGEVLDSADRQLRAGELLHPEAGVLTGAFVWAYLVEGGSIFLKGRPLYGTPQNPRVLLNDTEFHIDGDILTLTGGDLTGQLSVQVREDDNGRTIYTAT